MRSRAHREIPVTEADAGLSVIVKTAGIEKETVILPQGGQPTAARVSLVGAMEVPAQAPSQARAR